MGVLESIVERVRERQRRYEHLWTSRVFELAEGLARREHVLIGMCSVVALESHWRLADPSAAIQVDGTQETATALARDYLRVKFPRGCVPWRGFQFHEMPEPFAPYAARTTVAGMLVYVDLRAAYWNITRRVGWDVVYIPGRVLGRRSDVSDFPWPNHRLARNALVTSGFPGVRRILYRGKWTEEPAFNPLLNLSLAWLVSDVLHAIASEALEEGAVCVHTDGYVFDSLERAERFMLRVAEWGLEASVRCAGPGVVKAPGAWRIGPEETETFRIVRLGREAICRVREVPHRAWMKRLFAQLADGG